jgi:hypothetical protein
MEGRLFFRSEAKTWAKFFDEVGISATGGGISGCFSALTFEKVSVFYVCHDKYD